MSYVYLAGPYSFPACERQQEIEHQRYLLHRELAWRLLERDPPIWVYAPIVHCHPLAKAHKLPVTYDFWSGYNKAMLEPARELIVATFVGWETSKGVREEIEFANDKGIQMSFLDPAVYGVPNPNFTP